MRYLQRITPLPTRVTQALKSYQDELGQRLSAITLPKKRTDTIDDFWKYRRDSFTLQAIEVALKAMASGIERCMYCDEGHGHQIEHFRPKALYENETFDWNNLLWVCGECNIQKNSEFDEQILNPTSDDPLEHLELAFSEGRFSAKNGSTRGAITLSKLKKRLEDQALIKGRKNAFDLIHVLVQGFPDADDTTRAKIRHILVNAPFGSVFAMILRSSREPDAALVLGKPLLDVLARHREMYDWLTTADDERRIKACAEIENIAKRIRVGIVDEGA